MGVQAVQNLCRNRLYLEHQRLNEEAPQQTYIRRFLPPPTSILPQDNWGRRSETFAGVTAPEVVGAGKGLVSQLIVGVSSGPLSI